jgi:hypothetical protein
MGTLRATGFSALLTALLATTAFAQQAQTRQGFWIGGGLGYGSLSCSGCNSLGGVTGSLKLGGTLSQNVLLGVESNAWTKSESGETLTMGNMSGAVYWYPMSTSGLFVKGGFGYSVLDDTFFGNSTGFGMLGGIGYDVRVGRNLSITPVANWYRGSFQGGGLHVFELGLGVTGH